MTITFFAANDYWGWFWQCCGCFTCTLKTTDCIAGSALAEWQHWDPLGTSGTVENSPYHFCSFWIWCTGWVRLFRAGNHRQKWSPPGVIWLLWPAWRAHISHPWLCASSTSHPGLCAPLCSEAGVHLNRLPARWVLFALLIIVTLWQSFVQICAELYSAACFFESLDPSHEISPLLKHKYFLRHTKRTNGHGAFELCFGSQGLVSGVFVEPCEYFCLFCFSEHCTKSQAYCECLLPETFRNLCPGNPSWIDDRWEC